MTLCDATGTITFRLSPTDEELRGRKKILEAALGPLFLSNPSSGRKQGLDWV